MKSEPGIVVKSLYGLFLCMVLFMILTACESKDRENQSEEVSRKESSLLGQWQDESGSVYLDIWMDDDGVGYGSISWEESMDAVVFWDFSGTITEQEFTYQNAVKNHVVYDEEGDSQDTEYYTDGSGKITYKDGKLYWKDDEEDAGADIEFSYMGEY